MNRTDIRTEYASSTLSSGWTVLAGPYDLLYYTRKAFAIYNCDATLTLSGVQVQANFDPKGNATDAPGSGSPNAAALAGPDANLWFTATTMNSIGPATVGTAADTNVYRWWRMRAFNRESSGIGVSGIINAVAG